MLKFNIIERANPRDLNVAKKFYAVAITDKTADLRMVAERIARETNFSTAEVVGSIEAFLLVVPKMLEEGYNVKLGDFGSYRLTMSSEGAATKEEFNASMIKGANLIFRPGKLFAQIIGNIKFSKNA